MIEVGQKIPDIKLKTKDADGIHDVATGTLFAGKKVALFAVPGAFTPTCSDTHLPGFLARRDDFSARGVDLVACVSVNDAFVMEAWGKSLGVGEKIVLLADGNGDLADALGLALDGTPFGMGKRSRRYAMLLDDGVVEALGVEPGPGVTVSGADHLLDQLG